MFITHDPRATGKPVILWEDAEGRPKPVGRFATVQEVPGHEDVETWTFDVPTTLATGSAVNDARTPIVDADGAPLWNGARIAFQLQSHYVNVYEGKGVFETANRYAGFTFVSDREYPNWGARGEYSSTGRDRYCAGGDYVREGDLTGHIRVSKGLGDPFEHGVTETWVRLDDDPRRVCTLTHSPVVAPGMR